MTRQVFKRVCAPSAMAAALIAAAWVASYRTNIGVSSAASIGQPRWDVSAARGLLMIAVTKDCPIDHARRIVASNDLADPAWQRRFDGVHWKNSLAGFSVSEQMAWTENESAQFLARPMTRIAIPYWMLFAVAFAPSTYRMAIAFRGKWRAAQGMCPDCGYNMVGMETPHGCPACAALSIAIEIAPEAQLAMTI